MVEADFDAIANKIKNRRIEMNMTLAALASAVGVNPQHIGNIEIHRKKVSIYERIETDHELVKKLIADHDKLWETMAKESQRVMEGAFAEKDKLIEEKEERIKMLLEKIAEKKAATPEPISLENSEEDASLEVVPGKEIL